MFSGSSVQRKFFINEPILNSFGVSFAAIESVLLPNEHQRTAAVHSGTALKLSVAVILLIAFSTRLLQVIFGSPLLLLEACLRHHLEAAGNRWKENH